MSDMIECATRAAYDAWHARMVYTYAPWEEASPSVREDWLASQRAAIEAIREPSDAMLDDGYAQSGPLDGAIAYALVADIWRAMIDEMLKP